MGDNGGRTGKAWTAARDHVIRVGTVCALCGGKVDKRQPNMVTVDGKRKRNPKAPSVDHITPLSILGINAQEDIRRHGVGNLQLAHMGCNMRKGNKNGTTKKQGRQPARRSERW